MALSLSFVKTIYFYANVIYATCYCYDYSNQYNLLYKIGISLLSGSRSFTEIRDGNTQKFSPGFKF